MSLGAERHAVRKVDRHDFNAVVRQRDAARAERDRLRDFLESIFDAARQPGDAALFNVVKHAELAFHRTDQEQA